MFLNSSDETYLKLVLNPSGNYHVGIFQGRQNRIDSLPLNFTAVVSDDRTTWRGEAFVPLSYFPPGVDRFNAMYTHNMTDRQYEQVYPQKTPITIRASYHRLQDMETIDFDSIVPKCEQLTEYSEVWTNKMRTYRQYSARKLWKGGPPQILPPPMKLQVHQLDNGNMVKVIASGLFFDDPAPPSPPGPLEDLYNYEVVELFTLNSADKTYLRVELGPYGHYSVMLYRGYKNNITKESLPLDYTAVILNNGTTWQGEAFIPLDYFPPGVDQSNFYAMHGLGEDRRYDQAYAQTVPLSEPSVGDSYRLQDFQPTQFGAIVPSEKQLTNYSKLWTDYMNI